MKEQGAKRNDVSRFILLWISISFFLFCNQVFGAIPSSERAALIALYNSTDGDNWNRNNGWKTPPLAADGFAMPGTENTWYGIYCDSSNTAVLEISQAWNNLQGTLPPELGSLTNLQSLIIAANQLNIIPPELGNLSNLSWLNLSYNNLISIPQELGNLNNLETLYLHGNNLTSIPPELGNLINLKWLWLANNSLNSIPQELGNLNNLEELYLHGNNLNSIPPELGDLLNLESLILSGNHLISIPPEIGSLTKLKALFIEANNLKSIPPEIGNLYNLLYLVLSNNYLTGKMSEFGNLGNLRVLDLSNNNLSGGIPPELGNLTNLQVLYLFRNNLEGRIPPELGSLSNLEDLCLFDNKLTGSIPQELGNLTNLQVLQLDRNRLSGRIPANLLNLTSLGRGDPFVEGINISWNALYTNNAALRDFIKWHYDSWYDHWETTQTVAPKGITASPASPYSIKLRWKTILYKENPGCYRVFYSTAANGYFKLFKRTADKYIKAMTITGLKPGTTYYFKIQSRTYPHARNQNTVDSEFSRVVSAATDPAFFTISGTINYRGSGLPGVTLSLSNNGGTVTTGAKGYYYARVKQGWSGTVTPSMGYYRFTPAQRTYAEVSSEQTGQDFEALIPVTLHIGAERKTERAFIISRDYGVITLSLENKNNIPGIRCVLEKKIKGGIFLPIKEFAGTELSGGAYVYTDKFLDRDKSYTYRLVAYDSESNYLTSSAETTI